MKYLISLALVCAPFLVLQQLSAQTLPTNYVRLANGTSISRTQQIDPDKLYVDDTVRTIAITFEDSNWWQLVDSIVAYGEVTYGDHVLDSVAVKIKGSSSDFLNNTLKKSFDLEFDAIKDDQELAGYARTNLHSGIFDPSHVRERIFSWVGGHYLPIAKSNYVRLTINGDNWGVYTNTQQLNRTFLREWFVDPSGPRWRGESPFGRTAPDTNCFIPQPRDGRQAARSALQYLGQDSAAYYPYYITKGPHGEGDWAKLTGFIDKLNNIPENALLDSLDLFLNVDGALWFLAHEILLGDEDSYVYKTQSDYYLYHEDATGRMIPLEYDGNSCLELSSLNWGPLHRADDPCLPLLNRLLSVPEWRQRYLAHCRTIVEKYMHPDVLLPKIAQFAELIDTFELDDPIGDSLYTYQEFQDGVNSLNEYIMDRHDFLQAHPLLDVVSCALSDEEASMPDGSAFNPTSLDSVFVSVLVTGVPAGEVRLYYAPGLGLSFAQTPMFDDGAHGDGLPNDGRYGASIPAFAAQTEVVYYFEAQTLDLNPNQTYTSTFYPEGAEHDVFTYTVAPDRAIEAPVKINELMASNDTTAVDDAGESEDWIELYNATDDDIDLNGYSLSDREVELDKWTIDTTMVIPANGFLIIWCDEDAEQGPNHANFKLSRAGEHIFLTNPMGDVADDVRYDEQTTDVSLAREVDGTGMFIQQAPTFGITNVIDTTSSAARPTFVESLELSFYPNPISLNASSLRLQGPADAKLQVELYDALGHHVQNGKVRLSGGGQGRLPLTLATMGVYTVRVRSSDGKQAAAYRLVVQ